MLNKVRDALFGKPLSDSQLGGEKFNVLWGIPVFASDAISSVSYAGEEILLVLLPVLGAASYGVFLPVVVAIIGLLAILVFCYRQTIDAYPRGGGAYIVAKDNLGEKPGLVAGGALIIGYILTVAVSACAGAAAVTSAFPELFKYKALIAFVLVCILTWGNLRGLRESAVMFGVPTYLFIITMLAMIVTGIVKFRLGLYTPEEQVIATESAADTMLFLILKAFASGCTALTGVEAVSNGVPNFRAPETKNAKKVLYAMAGFVCIVFFGVSLLVKMYYIVPGENATAVSQLAAAVFGNGSIMYYVVQIMTVVILALAANTAFAGLPLLMALMAEDGYLPRQLVNRGSRLNFSNGIALLFAAASILIFAFNGDQHLLLPLYASGVFISFLLSQLGMLVHWVRNKGSKWQLKAAVNALGTVVTGVTLVIIAAMKFTQGAWVTLVCILILLFVMVRIKRHYDYVSADLKLSGPEEARELLSQKRAGKVILPVQSVNRSFMKTLDCALSYGFTDIELFNVSSSLTSSMKLKAELDQLGIPFDFKFEVTKFRNTNEILIKHIKETADRMPPKHNLTVMISALMVEKPLERLLHNSTTDKIKRQLAYCRNVSVFTVPYII